MKNSRLPVEIPHRWVNCVLRTAMCRSAVTFVTICLALAQLGCAKRFGGAWPFGEDQTAQLKKWGPAPVQRITAMREKAKKISKGTPQEKEDFTAELAKQIQNETDCNVRLAIVNIVAKFDTTSSKAILYAGLKDPEVDVRVACCQAWSKRPSADATQILAETLSGDTDHDVRLAAAKALGTAGDKEAVKALGTALEDSDPSMQFVAVAS
ncbi:MAG TPA: HEAT repeat domain-containing protein, partial [Pirellulales bacterium]